MVQRDEAARVEATDTGCITYLRKPFGRHDLLHAISKAVV